MIVRAFGTPKLPGYERTDLQHQPQRSAGPSVTTRRLPELVRLAGVLHLGALRGLEAEPRLRDLKPTVGTTCKPLSAIYAPRGQTCVTHSV